MGRKKLGMLQDIWWPCEFCVCPWPEGKKAGRKKTWLDKKAAGWIFPELTSKQMRRPFPCRFLSIFFPPLSPVYLHLIFLDKSSCTIMRRGLKPTEATGSGLFPSFSLFQSYFSSSWFQFVLLLTLNILVASSTYEYARVTWHPTSWDCTTLFKSSPGTRACCVCAMSF
jgi:hypothetical protein